MWYTQAVLMTWRFCSTEEDLLYSHKCPSLIKMTHRRPQLGSTMTKSGQCDTAVSAATQGMVALELQLKAFRHSLMLHSTPAHEK